MPDVDELRDSMKLNTVQRYLTGSETLRLTVYNAAAGVTVAVSGRRFDPDSGISEFAHRLTPSTNRTASTLDVAAGSGWLLGLAVRVTAGAPLDGQTYAVVEIGSGNGNTFQALDVLCADSITAAKRLGWPGSPLRGPLESPGTLRMISGTTPAAGADVFETVPTGARWELLYFKANLATSAVAANRQPSLTFDDGTNFYATFPAHTVLAASSNRNFYWSAGMDVKSAASATGHVQGIGAMPFLLAGHRISTGTISIDAGDQWSSVRYVVRERIEGA